MTETWILYQTTNLVNGKVYVGVHKLSNTSKSKTYLGSGLALKPATEKYGKDNFKRVTLAEFSCAKDAYAAEADTVTEEFVKRLDTYNMKIGGMGSKGIVFTEESKAKLSAALKGRTHTTESKARMSIAQKGKTISEEHKAKIGARSKGNKYNLGKVFSTETRANHSAAQKGKTLTPETKAKISAFQKGRVRSKETRAKMSAAAKGRVVTIEARAKLSAAHKGVKYRLGIPHSEETKAKMSASISEEYKAKMCADNGIATVIHGKYYPSATFASTAEKASTATILNRVRSENPKWSEWRYATEEEKAEYHLKNIELRQTA